MESGEINGMIVVNRVGVLGVTTTSDDTLKRTQADDKASGLTTRH